jgi:hypothetical protein
MSYTNGTHHKRGTLDLQLLAVCTRGTLLLFSLRLGRWMLALGLVLLLVCPVFFVLFNQLPPPPPQGLKSVKRTTPLADLFVVPFEH